MLDVITLYQNLDNKYKVEVQYSIGLGHSRPDPELVNLSLDVMTVMFHLNSKSFTSTDFDQKSLFKLTLRNKETNAIVDKFTQDTDGYMDVFDKNEFLNFLIKHNN
jgi:hypothetical protein